MNVAITTNAAEGFPRRAFSVDDVQRMIDIGVIGEDEKFELVEGEIVMMAGKGIAHERIKSALIIAISRALPDDMTIAAEASLRLSEMTMLEPDISVFPKSLYDRAVSGFTRVDPGEAHLVVEVAVSSLAYDRGLKAGLYARHRVKELWVIDASERITWIHTGPNGDGWSSIVERGFGETLATPTLPNLAIRLSDI
jgi:Uma2 family endonuclease